MKFVNNNENFEELLSVCETFVKKIGKACQRRFYGKVGNVFNQIRKTFVIGRPEHFKLVIYQIKYPNNTFLNPDSDSNLKKKSCV